VVCILPYIICVLEFYFLIFWKLVYLEFLIAYLNIYLSLFYKKTLLVSAMLYCWFNLHCLTHGNGIISVVCSALMDCVGCEKCRLWGKLQVLGLGTALKILFSDDGPENMVQTVSTSVRVLFLLPLCICYVKSNCCCIDL